MLDAVIEEVAITGFITNQADLFQVAQCLEAISTLINLIACRENLQFWTTLGKEDKKQTIDDGQAIVLHFCLEVIIGLIINNRTICLNVLLAKRTMGDILHIVKCLIGQGLYSQDNTFLQIFGYLIGILVTLFNQAVHQYGLSISSQCFFVHQQLKQGIVIA